MKQQLATLLILVTLIFTACGSSSSTTQINSTQQSASLPTETELALGTLKLEGTQQTVSAEQAKELLFMWKAYRALYSSDTTAQAEIDGLLKQIQGTMTSEQMEAISAMNLVQQDVSALIQEQGVQTGSSGGEPALQNSASAAPPDGGGDMAGGAPPDGGMEGMVDAGQNASSGQSQAGAPSIAGSAGTTSLVEALIQVLEEKVSV